MKHRTQMALDGGFDLELVRGARRFRAALSRGRSGWRLELVCVAGAGGGTWSWSGPVRATAEGARRRALELAEDWVLHGMRWAPPPRTLALPSAARPRRGGRSSRTTMELR